MPLAWPLAPVTVRDCRPSMRKVETQLANVISYSAGVPITPIPLPTEQLITRLDLDWSISAAVTTAAAWNNTALPRATWNQFGIQGGPSYYVSLSDPLTIYTQNILVHGGVVSSTVTSTATTAAVVSYLRQRFHFGSFPFKHRNEDNPFDFTAGIIGPVYSKGGLILTATMPANTVLGSNITVNTATAAYLIMSGILATNQELLAMRMAQPSFGETDIQLSAIGAVTGLSGRQDLPTGQYLRRLVFSLLDNSSPPVFDNTRLTDIALVFAYEGDRRAIESTWIPLVNESGMKMGNPVTIQGNNPGLTGIPNTGMAQFDLRAHVSADPSAPDAPTYGMNLIAQQAGNAQLAMSVATANGQLKMFTEQMKPAMQTIAPPVPSNAQMVAGSPTAGLLSAGR